MKVILDVIPEDRTAGLQAVQQVEAQFPDQEVGKENSIQVEVQAKPYRVVRNLNSYTVLGDKQEELFTGELNV